MKVNPNAPAFPESYIGNERPHEGIGDGLTVRAYFAIRFMTAMAGSEAWSDFFIEEYNKEQAAWAARIAITSADALITELNKENSND